MHLFLLLCGVAPGPGRPQKCAALWVCFGATRGLAAEDTASFVTAAAWKNVKLRDTSKEAYEPFVPPRLRRSIMFVKKPPQSRRCLRSFGWSCFIARSSSLSSLHIHPSIICCRLSLEGCGWLRRGPEPDPAVVEARGGVHPGQVACLSQG